MGTTTQVVERIDAALASIAGLGKLLWMDAWCLEVTLRPEHPDPMAAACRDRLAGLGVGIEDTRILGIRGFLLPKSLPREQVERAARELFADPIADLYRIAPSGCDDTTRRELWPEWHDAHRVSVRRLPGVMDAVARSAQRALADLGLEVEAVGTYSAWLLEDPELDREILENAGAALANEVVEEVLIDCLPPGLPLPGGTAHEVRVEIPLEGLSDEELLEISARFTLSLNLEEMQTIRAHFVELARVPTLTELDTLAQTWSEHCKHKTLTGRVEYEGPDGRREYQNLLKETVFATTKAIDHPFCWTVFVDNAGVIDFDGEDGLAIKVETHNHPSAIEPFGGAGTGIGGVIRDILGTGLGAKPLCNIDVFCVAPPDMKASELPPGTLHPARVLDGVIRGVRDYGNPMGIPTVTGAVHFDPAFVGNPLVYAGTVGIIPKNCVEKESHPGDRIFVAGGRTGRDGIHGATFSSVELTEDSETVSSGAVQIGDPITEKKVLDGLLVARDEGLYTAVTDCGAGGLSSAIGEMGEKLGARVHLENVPLKYEGLTPTEVWISEAQERMVFSVPQKHVDRFREVFERYEVETSDLGEFTDDGRLVLHWHGEEIANMSMEFLHDGVPRPSRKARWSEPLHVEPEIEERDDYGPVILEALADWGTCSKEWILRQYDHEVQAHSAAKPFSGAGQQGPGDAAVLVPKPESSKGFAVATGLNPRYSWIDPAAMAEAALDEAMRNVVCRGGDPTHTAILDNYCWGNCDKPEQLGALVRATEALCASARGWHTPFVSGKDSLHNEFRVGDETIAIPGCILVTALAIVPDVAHVPDSAFVVEGAPVYLVGKTYRELGGSLYYKLHGGLGNAPPRARILENVGNLRFLSEAIQNGWVRAAHDPSEGGLAVAAAEMAFGGNLGITLDLAGADVEDDMRDDEVLFSESLGRVLVEVRPEHEQDFVRFLTSLQVPLRKIGITTSTPRYRAEGQMGDMLFDLALDELEEAWRTPLEHGPIAAARRAELSAQEEGR